MRSRSIGEIESELEIVLDKLSQISFKINIYIKLPKKRLKKVSFLILIAYCYFQINSANSGKSMNIFLLP